MHSIAFKSLCATIAGLALSATASAANVVTKVVDLGPLSTPSQTLYSTSFNAIAGGFSTANGATLTDSDRFFENYAFTIAPSTVASLSSTLSFADFFGISNLQARLYQGDVNTVITGSLAGTGVPLVVAWGQSFTSGQSTVTNALIAPVQLAAGSYVLQVRGTVSGDFGGSYTGNIALSPIPEPETYALFAAGLLAIGFLMNRSRRSH